MLQYRSLILAALLTPALVQADKPGSKDEPTHGAYLSHEKHNSAAVQLGPRPFYLIEDMDTSALKKRLQACAKGPFKKTLFSIGHRGAPLQFPEHTKES